MASEAKTMPPTGRALSQLRWLCDQRKPVWGGVKSLDCEMQDWIDAGWIAHVTQPEPGYRITAAGRAAVVEAGRLPPPPRHDGSVLPPDVPPIRYLFLTNTDKRLQVYHQGRWINVPNVKAPPHTRQAGTMGGGSDET